MLTISIQKIIKQKWLSICILLGLSLLIAIFVCQPMFESGSLDKLLSQTFDSYIEKNNMYPATVFHDGEYKLGDPYTLDQVMGKVEGYRKIWSSYLDRFEDIGGSYSYRIHDMSGKRTYNNSNEFFETVFSPELDKHINIVTGSDGSNLELQDGVYPCIISQNVMDAKGLVVGEEIEFDRYYTESKQNLKLVVAGVFVVNDGADTYWYESPYKNDKTLYVNQNTMERICSDYGTLMMHVSGYMVLNHDRINSHNIDYLITCINSFKKNDASFGTSFDEVLKMYVEKRKSIGVMLWVLEIPVLVMLIAFIYMVSGQMADSMSAEIAMQRSRGFSKVQVVSLYTTMALLLSIGAYFIGVPLGYLICRISASTTDFLKFSGQDVSMYRMSAAMPLYGLLAAALGVIIVVIPTFARLKVSIVEQKADYAFSKRMFWEKYFLDIVLLAVSIYLLYNYNHSIDSLREQAIVGGKMDPMIFVNTCMFMVAMGLVVFRIIHYIVMLIYYLGRNKWKPVSYVSFLQITRSFSKQCFISVFMILTVAMGLFDANVARTINRNKEDRIVYSNGCDIIIKEKWDFYEYKESAKDNRANRRYYEPDYIKYQDLVKEGKCESVTRVLKYDSTVVQKEKVRVNDCMVMGINTKEFGETAYLKDELNADKHWFNYLNDLAQNGGAAIISSNLAEILTLDVGDTITVYGFTMGRVDETKLLKCKVVDIVDNWPGYDRYDYSDGTPKERYLTVINYATMVQNFELTPYEVWARKAAGVKTEDVYNAISQSCPNLTDFISVDDKIDEMKNAPDIQIINGMFTLSFMISLVLCGVGFLIYWIASIQSRELLFGVYMAMGLSKKDVNHMLVYEHIFSTFTSVLAGGGVGMCITMLFIQLFCVAYLPEKSNLGVYIYYQAQDFIKLFTTIAVMIIICMTVLRYLIARIDITSALKKGED